MNLIPYAPHWSVFRRQQLADLQILLVSTRPEQDKELADSLSRRGYMPLCVSPSDMADVQLSDTGLHLSEEMPNAKGSHWIYRSSQNLSQTPERLPKTALDFTHPDIASEISIQRIEVVIDRVLSARLFDGMIDDLKKLVLSGEQPASSILQPFHQHLVDLRVATPSAPAFCIVDSDTSRGNTRRYDFSSAAAPSLALTPKQAQAHFASSTSSDVALVSIPCPTSLPFISALRDSWPELPILAQLDQWDKELASRCIQAGATDIVVPNSEGLVVSTQRLGHHIQSVRRERYYLAAITELSSLVQQVCPSYDSSILFR